MRKKTCSLYYNSFQSSYIKVSYPFNDLQSCHKKSCSAGEFLCNRLQFCISLELLCDGINHCLYNEDEQFCSLQYTFPTILLFY